jgi:hypothetical protein
VRRPRECRVGTHALPELAPRERHQHTQHKQYEGSLMHQHTRLTGLCSALACGLLVGLSAIAMAQNAPAAKPAESKPATSTSAPAGELAALPIVLPTAAFKGTPDHKEIKDLEPPRNGPRPPFMAPKGAKNLALNKPVTGSQKDPVMGSYDLVTDGDKEANDDSYVELGKGTQWVQIDLGERGTLYAILLWHYHGSPTVYRDVVVQVSNEPDFVTGVTTVFNNDVDNSAGLGIGKDREYTDTYEGKLIDTKGVKARYVRVYGNGSHTSDQNHVTEVEVWGTPAK